MEMFLLFLSDLSIKIIITIFIYWPIPINIFSINFFNFLFCFEWSLWNNKASFEGRAFWVMTNKKLSSLISPWNSSSVRSIGQLFNGRLPRENRVWNSRNPRVIPHTPQNTVNTEGKSALNRNGPTSKFTNIQSSTPWHCNVHFPCNYTVYTSERYSNFTSPEVDSTSYFHKPSLINVPLKKKIKSLNSAWIGGEK